MTEDLPVDEGQTLVYSGGGHGSVGFLVNVPPPTLTVSVVESRSALDQNTSCFIEYCLSVCGTDYKVRDDLVTSS